MQGEALVSSNLLILSSAATDDQRNEMLFAIRRHGFSTGNSCRLRNFIQSIEEGKKAIFLDPGAAEPMWHIIEQSNLFCQPVFEWWSLPIGVNLSQSG